MAAPARTRPTYPDGREVVLRVGRDDALAFVIKDDAGEPRDNATDTYSIAAKLDTTTKTLTVAKDTPSTDGKGTVTFPAAQLDAAGELYVDIMAAKSGGNANVEIAWQITVEASPAG